MTEKNRTKSTLHWTRYSGLALVGVSALTGCGEFGRDKASEAEIAQEQEDTRVATVQEAATVTNWLFREDFNTLKVTRNLPGSPFTSHNWYSQEDTNFNGEVQRYRTYLYNDALTTPGANGIVCNGSTTDKTHCTANNWTLRIREDQGAGDSVDGDVNGAGGDNRVLQIRAIRDTSTGTIYSARLSTKRFQEFVPTPSKGIKVEIRMKYQTASISGGFWPAFWMLGSR
ncbi:MAG TPA: hypothetical protein VM686_12190, partial [Polyangiaceae bacterium]|nr:hypothetical protein [Polyangiaceae bacterium]